MLPTMPQYGQDRLYFEYSAGNFEVRRLALWSLQFTQPRGFTGVPISLAPIPEVVPLGNGLNSSRSGSGSGSERWMVRRSEQRIGCLL